MKLPIFDARQRILDAVKSHPVTVVVGETGSGKTTQIPPFLYEASIAARGMIGVTNPSPLPATSTSQFVASQLRTTVGNLVGYQIRFDDATMEGTKIKSMTDG